MKVYYCTTSENLIRLPLVETTFTYANSGWLDQLIAVNDVELTYDENGNVLTYGDKEYTWESGRNLKSITDSENTYSYTYDENGIKTSKTVNGVTTYYNTQNGVILSQTDGTNTMYFQYDTNGKPLGFIYNGTQYFYMTNQMGDVFAVTDSQGNVFIEYQYDEWGKLINTLTIDEDNAEQLAIAEANPIRYRGYYYDNETGYYYLQSRYYDPSICRFINSDIPKIAQMSKDVPVGSDLFTYCNNNPVNNSDPSGMAVGILTAASIGAILLALVAAIGITWALSTIISRIDYSFVSDTLNSLSQTYKLKFAVIKTLVVGCIKSAYSYAKQIAITATKAVSLAVSIAVAVAKVKTVIKKDRNSDYWSAYLSNGVIILGNRLTRNTAVSRIRKGLNVMSRSKSCAKTAAYIAGGNRKPQGPERHGSLGNGFYWHYHIYMHKNDSHIFYI